MMFRKTIGALLLIFVSSMIMSCGKDECDPPFYPVNSLPGLSRDSVKVGKVFECVFGMVCTSVGSLENVDIKVTLPDEIEIVSIKQQVDGLNVIRGKQAIEWKGNVRHSFLRSIYTAYTQTSFTILLKSKTDRGKWSRPIESHVSLDFKTRWGEHCNNYPNGHYESTIKLSREGTVDFTDWDMFPDGYGGQSKR